VRDGEIGTGQLLDVLHQLETLSLWGVVGLLEERFYFM
jgi:hypothetical protein